MPSVSSVVSISFIMQEAYARLPLLLTPSETALFWNNVRVTWLPADAENPHVNEWDVDVYDGLTFVSFPLMCFILRNTRTRSAC